MYSLNEYVKNVYYHLTYSDNTHEATCLGYDQAIPVDMTTTQDDYYMDMRLNKDSSGYTPVNTLPTKKAPSRSTSCQS